MLALVDFLISLESTSCPDRFSRDHEQFMDLLDQLGNNFTRSFKKQGKRILEFVKDVKQGFTRLYNKLHNRKGTLWGESFKSVIV